MMNFKIFLTEGMIKLPEKMFKEGEKLIASEICSWVTTELDGYKDPEVHKFLEHVKKFASKYSAPLRYLKNKTHSKFKLKVELDDLPDKYQKLVKKSIEEHTLFPSLKLELDIDWKYKGRLKRLGAGGFYRNTEAGKIVIGISRLIDFDPKKKVKIDLHNASLAKMDGSLYKSHLYTTLVDWFDPRVNEIMENFEHELTHFIQHKILSVGDVGQISSHSEKVGGGKEFFNDKYHASQIEFDPQIKTAIGRYHRQEKDNIESKMKGSRRGWIDIFVGAKVIQKSKFDIISSEAAGGFITPSEFFLALKRHDPAKWKKAVKLFTQELEKRYPA